jgi:hypothetical protein
LGHKEIRRAWVSTEGVRATAAVAEETSATGSSKRVPVIAAGLEIAADSANGPSATAEDSAAVIVAEATAAEIAADSAAEAADFAAAPEAEECLPRSSAKGKAS